MDYLEYIFDILLFSIVRSHLSHCDNTKWNKMNILTLNKFTLAHFGEFSMILLKKRLNYQQLFYVVRQSLVIVISLDIF